MVVVVVLLLVILSVLFGFDDREIANMEKKKYIKHFTAANVVEFLLTDTILFVFVVTLV